VSVDIKKSRKKDTAKKAWNSLGGFNKLELKGASRELKVSREASGRKKMKSQPSVRAETVPMGERNGGRNLGNYFDLNQEKGTCDGGSRRPGGSGIISGERGQNSFKPGVELRIKRKDVY